MQLAVGHAADIFQNARLHVDLSLEADGAFLVVHDHVAYLDAVLVQGFEFGYRLAVRQGDFPGGFLWCGRIRISRRGGNVLRMAKPQEQASRVIVNFRNMFMEIRL